MKKYSNNQKGLPAKISVKSSAGFGAVEMLLLVLIVLVAAFAGYYVAHNHNQTKPVASASTSTTKKSTTSTQKYFTITPWGIRAPYDGSLTLDYTTPKTDSQGLTYTLLSSTELDNSDPTCVNGGYGGSLARYLATDEYLAGDGEVDSGMTAAAYAATLSSADYGHAGNYYYFLIHAQGICGSSQSSQDLLSQTASAFKTLLPELQVIPQ